MPSRGQTMIKVICSMGTGESECLPAVDLGPGEHPVEVPVVDWWSPMLCDLSIHPSPESIFTYM